MQNFTDIPSSRTLSDSLDDILNNDKTTLSNSSGTAFPTTQLQAGMLCHRTDLQRLYQLTTISPLTWRYVADLKSDIDQQFNAKLNASSYSAGDILTKLKSVDGSGSGVDADLLDGKQATDFASSSHHHDAQYPSLNGRGATGSWGIDITGKAATAGSASTASYSNAANGKWVSAAIAGSATAGNQSSVEVRNNGGTGDGNLAAISFHCQGTYGIHLHLRGDGYFGLGGWNSGAWRWYSTPSGDMVASGNVIAYSDRRLKEEISPITSALDCVKQLNGVRFRWIEKSFLGRSGQLDTGLLADNVKEVVPEAVSDSAFTAPEGDAYQAVAYDKLVPLLIEAIKELEVQVTALQEMLSQRDT
jgi:hypothetical protein